MKGMKVSALVGLSVTLLAVVTAVAFSIATVGYQKQIINLKKVNHQYSKTLVIYAKVLAGIKEQLTKIQK